MSTFKWIAAFALASAVVNGTGIYTIYKTKNWVYKFKDYFLCFAAGVLISTPLLIALPHAIENNEYAGIFALAGFLFMLIINKFISENNEKDVAFGITGAFAIGFHSFVDGVIYTITFSASTIIGILSATGLVAHEFAEGVITYTFLSAGGFSPQKAALYAFFVAGLTTPLGAFVVYPFISTLDKSVIQLLTAFTAGMLIYFSASHLIPEARESEKKHSILALISGLGFAIVLSFIHKD
ncbi:MAG TPA: ZIP family metal transporter [Elusimicrobiales bacterium]|mgnify:CR=1 FL=1|nr:ZIP family metal transporter [Elusimicrobiales bacterium]HOL62538.1 ZIP family metal transporter [Elusimicrobiales bacterium]HPO95361.1 ZIP family metal transporter [Elusimicrobiales bacterium]